MTQDPYTELAARLGIERTEAKELALAILYGPGFDFSAATESGSAAASENHMSLETIMAITGDDSVRARRASDGAAEFVDVKTLYADFVSESRAGKAAFTRFLERSVGGADDSKEAGA
jgi:hypothetical protein